MARIWRPPLLLTGAVFENAKPKKMVAKLSELEDGSVLTSHVDKHGNIHGMNMDLELKISFAQAALEKGLSEEGLYFPLSGDHANTLIYLLIDLD